MAEEKRIRVAVLNVVASPHPEGVYERLFRSAASQPVKYRGDYRAAITGLNVSRTDQSLLLGRLLVWMEISPDNPAVDRQKLQEIPLSRELKDATRTTGFNLRVFRFALDSTVHRVTIETLTENGQTLSPHAAETIFQRLLSPAILGADAEMVDVTAIPDDDALSRVLGLERLDRIEIVIKRTNPDDISADTAEILARLQQQNAKRQDLTLVRAPKTDGLNLNDDNQKLAAVAAEGNGRVSSKGRNSDDQPESRSTEKYPKILERLVPAGETFLTALQNLARSARQVRRGS